MIQTTEFATIIDLVKRFPDNKSCHTYLASRRWEGLMVCPHCSHEKAYVFKDGIRYKCASCKKQYTAITGTIFEATKLPLINWFMAIYLLMHKKGISSVQLSKDIGVTQKTAWFMLQRLREALGNEAEEQLEGVVEIDESFVGGKAKFKHKDKKIKYNPGRGWKDKTPVLGMLQRGGKVKAMVIPDVLMLTLKKATLKHIKGGSEVMGDGFTGYRGLSPFFDISCVDHGKGLYVDGDCHTNGIENFWSQMKRSLGGIYVSVSPKHLNKYVQESAFRYNYRNLGVQSQMNLIIDNMNCRLKYKDLVA